MKAFLRSLILIIALCAGCVVNAQSLDEYTFSTGVDTNKWITLTTYTDVSGSGSGDSWASAIQSIGFSFPFDENVYTQFSVNSDGNLRLGSTVTGTGSYSSPFSSTNANTNSPKINFFGCDGYLVANTHYVHSQLFGDSLLVVEYCLGPYSSTYRNNQFTWQIHLYSNGKIEAVFGDNAGLSSSSAHQMGLCVNSSNGWIIASDNSATHFTSGSTTNWTATTWPAEGTYYTFTRPFISCPRPESATVSNITATTAVVSFVPGGSETSWIGTITPGILGMNTMTLTDTVVNLMLLTPNTEYTVSVRAICGVGDTSTERTVTFRTNCVALTAADLPYVEDFEEYGSGAAYGISPCWTKFSNSATAYPYPYATAAINGTRGLYFYSYKPSTATGTSYYSYAALPEVASSLDLSGLTLRFNAKRYTSTSATYRSLILVGVMTDPTDISTFALVDTVNLTHEAVSSVHAIELNLDSYTGTGKYVAFYSPVIDTTGIAYNYIYIDDVELTVTPTCHRPNNVTMSSFGSVGGTVTWTPYSADQTNFEVAYGTGTNPAEMTTISATGTSAYLSSLTPNTVYHVFVRAICDSNDYGEWSAMVTFRTTLEPVIVSAGHPFVDNFEGDTPWQFFNDATNQWVIGSAEGNTGNSLYISNDNGVTNSYATGAVQWSFAVKTLLMPAGDYTYSFDWKANGEGNYDYLRAFLVPTSTILAGGVSPNGSNPYNFRSETPAGWVALDGGNKLNQVTAWQTDSGSLTLTATMSNYNLVFVWANDGSGGTQPPAAIDNVNITLVPPAVYVNLAVNDTLMGNTMPAPGSYTLHVGDVVNAVAYPNNGYQFDYWIVNMGPITDSVTDNPVTFELPAILANMTFNITAHYSELPADPCRLTTPLAYGFETSEGFNTTTTSTSTTVNPFDNCWRNEETVGTTGKLWGIKNSASYAHTGTQSLMLSDKTSGTTTLLAFPPMEFNNPYGTTVSFWLYRNGTSTNLEGFRLYANTTDTITEDAVDLGFYSRNIGVAGPVAVNGTGWYQYEANVNMIGTVYLMMEGHSFYGNSTYVDDIEIYPTSSCYHPNDVVVSNMTPTTAVVSWTAGSDDQNSFVVAYGEGTDPDSMATVTASVATATLTGLTPNTTYNVYVKADCGDETSRWTSVESFHTPCLPISASALPLFENFDNITTSTTAATGIEPDCWSLAYQDVAMTASNRPQIYYSSSNANSGSYSLRLYYRGIYAMPAIDTNISDLQLSFYVKQTSAYYQLVVGVMSDLSDETTFVPVDTIVNTSTSVPEYHEVFFNNYTGNGQYIAFRNICTTTYSYSYNYIDDITVDLIPSCPTPNHVRAVPASTTSATVTWTPIVDANNYVVAYGTGTDPEYMSTVTSTSHSAVITGLTPETNYNVFVKMICDTNEESFWSMPAALYTGYCNPTPTSVDGQGITNVTFGSGSEIVNNSQRPTSSPYYGDYTSLVGGVEAGSQADVAITYATGYTYGTIIWVDWNNNLTFDGNEVVFVGVAPNTNPTVFNASFMIPATVDTGVYRMRIAGADSYYDSYTGSIAAAANANPCPTGSYTIVHDYSLRVNAAPSCFAPTNVTVTSVSAHSATVAWSISDTAANTFRVVYTDEYDNADSITVTGTSATLTGLSANTGYSIAVRTICSADDESALSTSASFYTTCDVIAVTEANPFYETFDATSSTLGCWSISYQSGAPLWGISTMSNAGSYPSYSGYSAYLPGTGSYATSALLTPILDLTGADSATLSFVYINPDWAGDQNELTVAYRNNDTSTWTSLGFYNTNVTSWTPVTLTIPVVSSTLQVAFLGYDSYGYCVGLDSVVVNAIVPEIVDPCRLALPLTYGFEAEEGFTTTTTGINTTVNPFDSCWRNEETVGSTGKVWGIKSSSSYAHTGTQSLMLSDKTAGTTTLLAFPPMEFTSPYGTTMGFWVYRNSTGSNMEGFRLYADLTDTITEDAVDLGFYSRNTNAAGPAVVASTGWYYYEVNIPLTGTVYLMMEGHSFYGNATYVDDIDIYPTSACSRPTDVVATPITTTSASVSWTTANESATGYVVAYGTGNDPDSMLTVTTNTTSATLTGLAPETSYNVYVKMVCSETEESIWSIPTTVYTGYCQPAPTSCDGQGISNVTFGSGTNIVNNSLRPASAPYYGNYSNLIGDVDAGTQANVAITYATGYTYGTIIWVDWNNNLTFEGNEVVFVGEAPNTNPTLFNASFMIPSTVDTGLYRMRIAGADSYYDSYTSSIAAAADANPCPTSSYTIVHDYSIHVNAAPSCLAPYNVVISNVAAHSATVSWTAGNPADSSFRVIYTDEFNSADSITVTGTTATLTGLSSNTGYAVEVRTICSATEVSTISSPAAIFYTLCDPYVVSDTTPFYETFDATSTTIDCWSVAYESNAPIWSLRTSSVSGSYSSYSGYSAFFAGSGTEATCALITPVLDFTGYDSATVSFVYINPDWSGDQNELSVKYRNGASGSWVNLGTYSSDVTTWTPVTLHIPTVSSALQVGFFGVDNYGYCVGLDSIVVAPALPAPPAVFTVNLATSDTAMGTTNPVPGTYTFFVGDTMGATAIPATGYHFVNWTIDMGGVTTSDTNNPIVDVVPVFLAGMSMNITANFAINQYTVTVAANDSTLGTVTGSGIYTHGATATLTAAPATHCRFVQWNDGDTHAVRTVTVTANATYTATFEAIPQQTVTLLVQGQGTVTGAGTYYAGDVATISATPDNGWEFVNWLNGTTVVSTDATLNVTIVEGVNITYTAVFNELPVPSTLTINVVEPGMGYVLVNGVEATSYTGFIGDTVVLTASVAEDCQFDGWGFLYGYQNIVTDGTVTYVLVASEDTVTAFFSRISVPAVLTVSAHEADMGTVLINGEAIAQYDGFVGDTVEITAVANAGYEFVDWSFTGNPLRLDSVAPGTTRIAIVLTEAITEAIANFMHLEGIDDVTADDIVIYSQNSSIVVRGAEQQTVRVFDVVGRLVAQRSSVNVEEVIAMPNTGIYLVKVGDRPARRVVVRR